MKEKQEKKSIASSRGKRYINIKFMTSAHSNSDTRPIPGCKISLGVVLTLQRHDSVNVLTSSRPPLDGADGGTVQDKLLCGQVICGCGLQPSEVSA